MKLDIYSTSHKIGCFDIQHCIFFYFLITYGVCKKRKYCFILEPAKELREIFVKEAYYSHGIYSFHDLGKFLIFFYFLITYGVCKQRKYCHRMGQKKKILSF